MPQTLTQTPDQASATRGKSDQARGRSASQAKRTQSRSPYLLAPTPAVRLGGATTNLAGGEPMQPQVRGRIEGSFNTDLSQVRVQRDSQAQLDARNLSARAFTVGNRIFLGQGARPDDVGLMAHESAHVVQQQAQPQPAPQIQRFSPDSSGPHEREAHQASHHVLHGQPFTVRERTSPRPQRLGISDVLDYFADKANIIPGFRMFTIILGVNPINMSAVDRSAANILRAVIEFIPGGGLITQALDNYGIFEKIGAWVEQQIKSLGMVGSAFKQAISNFIDSLSWSDIFHLGDVWDRAKRIFTEPIDRLINFAKGLIIGILRFIKEAILRPLAKLAEGTSGYDLLKAVLGEDPVTGDKVPQTADALIGGFMKLIGQEEVYNNLKRANAVSRAFAWFKGALSGLLGFVRQIPSLFIQALQSLELFDIVLLPRAFIKVGKVFLGFAAKFFSWALDQVLELLKIIFEVLAPGAVPYIQKAAGAFKTIIKNPIGFIGNLVKAGIQGFKQFGSRFLTHLRNSLISWLTGTMSGAAIYVPQAFNLREILKFVLSVLGLTWQNIRQKLVKAIGETAVKVLETGFDIVLTLVTQGPAAAWEKIKESLSNLQDMVMGEVMNFVRDRVVQAAITKLVTSLNPAGAFIQAVLAIYNTVMFFVERLKQIAQVAMAVIDAIAAIAAGVIAPAAAKVEQTMAGLLTLVISFLARIAGLGKVSDAVIDIVNKVRAPIDRALDRVVEWIVAMAKKVGKFIAGAARGAAQRVSGWLGLRRSFRTAGGDSHTLLFQAAGTSGQLMIRSAEMSLENFLADLLPKYARDPDKLAKVRAAQALVAQIKTLTSPGTATAAATPAVDAQVQAKIDQLSPLLQEIGDGVSVEGAVAAYRGLHWWADKGPLTPVQQTDADRKYAEVLTKQELGARQLSDAVTALVAARIPPGAVATEAQINTAIGDVNSKMSSLRDGTPYVEEGKTYYDRFHFLLSRYVTKLQAVRTRITTAVRLSELDAEIPTLQAQLSGLTAGTSAYYLKRKQLKDATEARRRAASGLPAVYPQLPPVVKASPFVATSLSAVKAAEYALGSLFTPQGKERRLTGLVGRMLVFVATLAQLVKEKTYSIDELRRAGKVTIRKGFTENEITFTGSIPGEYLKATLEAQAGQDANTVAGSATGRAAAEASRYGGLK